MHRRDIKGTSLFEIIVSFMVLGIVYSTATLSFSEFRSERRGAIECTKISRFLEEVQLEAMNTQKEKKVVVNKDLLMNETYHLRLNQFVATREQVVKFYPRGTSSPTRLPFTRIGGSTCTITISLRGRILSRHGAPDA